MENKSRFQNGDMPSLRAKEQVMTRTLAIYVLGLASCIGTALFIYYWIRGI